MFVSTDFRGELAMKLSAEGLKRLRRGDPVYVKWTGGNGPHMYFVVRDFIKHGLVTVSTLHEAAGALLYEIPQIQHELSVIGDHPLTQVWVINSHPRDVEIVKR